MAATIAANLLGDRNIWSAIVFALCNAGEAVLVAALIEKHFGSLFSLDRPRNVIGLLAAGHIRDGHADALKSAGAHYLASDYRAVEAIVRDLLAT